MKPDNVAIAEPGSTVTTGQHMIGIETGDTVHGITVLGRGNTPTRCGIYSVATGTLLHTSDIDSDGRIVTPAHFDEPTMMMIVLQTDGEA